MSRTSKAPPSDSMALAGEVANLCDRIKDNRQLTREVAMLLFQRGERPTANRVLQLTHRGSMVTVNDEMNKWWGDLREKFSTRLEHPTVPADLLEKQAEVIGSLWDQAMSTARAELDDAREAAEEKVATALAAQTAAETAATVAKGEAEKADARREETERALAGERAARAAAENEIERWRQAAEAKSLELERVQADFTAKLDALREDLGRSERQFDEARKRSLVELDAHRQRIAQLQDALRTAEIAAARLEESQRNLKADLQTTSERLERAETASAALTNELARANSNVAALESRLDALTAERDTLAHEREEDSRAHEAALAARDAYTAQQASTIASLERMEILLRQENERTAADAARLREENESLRAAIAAAPDKNGNPNDGSKPETQK